MIKKLSQNKNFVIILFISIILLFSISYYTFSKRPFISKSTTASSDMNLTISNPNALYSYEISNIEDISIGDIKRFIYKITVAESYKKDELLDIAKLVIQDAETSNPFNSLNLLFYDDNFNPIDQMPPLGRVTYYPFGDLEAASNVKTGDYSDFKLSNELKEKDWSLKPNLEDYKIFSLFIDIYEEEKSVYETLNTQLNEEDLITKLSTELCISNADIKNSLTKVNEWIFNNIN